MSGLCLTRVKRPEFSPRDNEVLKERKMSGLCLTRVKRPEFSPRDNEVLKERKMSELCLTRVKRREFPPRDNEVLIERKMSGHTKIPLHIPIEMDSASLVAAVPYPGRVR